MLKQIISILICVLLLVVLTEIVRGGVIGFIIGKNINSEAILRQELIKIHKNKGTIDKDIEKYLEHKEWYEKLPPDIRMELEIEVKKVIEEYMKNMNWFAITFLISIVVFAVVSFFFGYISKAFVLVGILVIVSFFLNNPLNFDYAVDLSNLQKTVIVLSQVLVSYLSGYWGALYKSHRAMV